MSSLAGSTDAGYRRQHDHSMNQNLTQRNSIPQKDFLPRLGSGCLVLLGALVVIIAIGTLASQQEGFDFFAFVFCALIGGGFVAAGIFWYRYVAAQELVKRALFEEKAVLNVAARHRGYATLAQIALETPFTTAESEAVMARLCRDGFAQPELMDDGTVRYRFGGLLGKNDE